MRGGKAGRWKARWHQARSGRSGPRKWRYLRPADLKRMRNMEFAARRIVEGYFSGKHRSPFRDFSQEFADYRAYVPGDDLRTLDWKAFAHTDRYYIKRFRKDTGMPCHLVLDKSNSMAYGGGSEEELSKLEYACFLVAALGFLIVKQGDRAGFCLFDDELRDYRPPGSAMSHLFGILNALEPLQPSGTTQTAEALREAFHLIRRRSLLIIVSDFLDDPAEIFSALSMFTHKQFEIILFHVLHDDELKLPEVEHARFIDLETRGTLVAEPDVIREAYDEELTQYLDQMRTHARARQIDYNLITTSTHYNEAIANYLAVRQSMQWR